MFFIGVISNRNERFFSSTINNEIKNVTAIQIKKENIESLKNVQFNTIIIKENSEILKSNYFQIEHVLKNAKYIIINSDIKINFKLFGNFDVKILTYGFNSKSTITASSITEENVLVCIQRNVENVNGKIIEPQEIMIDNLARLEPLQILAIISVLAIYGRYKNIVYS